MKIETFERIFANLHDKTEYIIHTRNWRQTLSHRLVLKKVHRMIKFNQNTWLKPEKKWKMILKKISVSWWIMQVLQKLWKMWENIEISNLSQQKEEGII